MPLLSVIIPSYNRAGLIARTLNSIFAQDCDNLEVLVVDDGSTDGTPDVVRAYGRPITLLEQENKGPGAARNLGLRSASGEYVAFLDSDDLWFPWTVSTYRSVIEKNNRPAFIAGKPLIFKSELELSGAADAPIAVEVFDDYYASGDQWRWFSASSFVMRRDALIAAGGFPDEWINGEDALAAMRMGMQKTFVQITSPSTFAYRKHAGSAMSNVERSFAGVRRLIDDEVSGSFPGGPARATERRRIISMFARPMSLEMVDQRRRDRAWAIYRSTFGWHLSLHRWKFLIGFPCRVLKNLTYARPRASNR